MFEHKLTDNAAKLDLSAVHPSRLESSISFSKIGDGPVAVALIHGWGCDASFWNPEQLSATDYELQIAHLDNHSSRSSPDSSACAAALGEQAADALSCIKKPVYIVGHSFGAAIAAQLALNLGPQVMGLIAVEGSLDIPPKSIEQMSLIASRIAQFGLAPVRAELLARSYNHTTELKALSEMVARRWCQGECNSLVRFLKEQKVLTLPVLTCPVHCVLGELSNNWSAYLEGLNTQGMRPQVHLVAGAAHFPMIEAPEAFYKIIRRILLLSTVEDFDAV